MNLTDIFHGVKAHKRRHRVGRGSGSGSGKTAGRGQKGLGSRTGANFLRGFVGGQTQLKERLPKVGFNNVVHAVVYAPVNLAFIDKHFADGETVDVQSLRSKGYGIRRGELLKVLGAGDISKKIAVKAHAISASARAKIEKAGGSVEIVPLAQAAGARAKAE